MSVSKERREPMTDSLNKTLTRGSFLSLGLVGGLLASSLLGYDWLHGRFAGLGQRMNAIELQLQLMNQSLAAELAALEGRIEDRTLYRWNNLDQRQWSLQLREANPQLTVPEVVSRR